MKFKEYPFSELLSNIVDNRGKTCPIAEAGIPLIATNCIKNDRLYPVFEKVRYVSTETYQNWFRGHPKPGDLIFVCKGSPGRVAWVTDPVPFCIAQDMVAIRADELKIHPKYLFALLRSKIVQDKIINMHVGTLIPHFKKGDFKNLNLSIPTDMAYQKKIGEIYFSFCEKIDSNVRTNEILENITQAIFKSWFVDFDPTHAKIAAKEEWENTLGNKTNSERARSSYIERAAMRAISGKSDGELNALDKEKLEKLNTIARMFPDALVESELGDVPMGWEIRTLSSMIHLIGGGTPNRSEATYWDGHIPWFSIKDVPNSSDVFVVSTEEKITTLGLEKSSTKLLPVGATIISARGTVGKLALVATPMCINQSCYGTIGVEGIGNFFNYFNLSEAISTLQKNAHGAVFDTITTKSFDSYSMAFCGDQLANKFDSMVEPLLKKIESNVRENIFLSDLRDSLLPRLLAGELNLDEVA